MIALSDVAELNMFVARSAQPMISLLLSFVRRYLIVKENRITGQRNNLRDFMGQRIFGSADFPGW